MGEAFFGVNFDQLSFTPLHNGARAPHLVSIHSK